MSSGCALNSTRRLEIQYEQRRELPWGASAPISARVAASHGRAPPAAGLSRLVMTDAEGWRALSYVLRNAYVASVFSLHRRPCPSGTVEH
jgi:hypothetical protein